MTIPLCLTHHSNGQPLLHERVHIPILQSVRISWETN